MQIIRAEHAGFCFGVRRAVSKAEELSKNPEKWCTLGDLIHNKIFVQKLAEKGINSVNSIDEIDDGTKVIIRSHGVPPSVYNELRKRGITYIDLTCPFVERIHKKVNDSKAQYDLIIIVGKEQHPEVVGIKGWAGEKSVVIYDKEEVNNLPVAESALVVCQTTFQREKLEEIYGLIRNKIKGAELFDSICITTQERQKEAEKLAKKSDAVIVIGDKNSSNTSKLFEVAQKNCKNVQYIESGSELMLESFSDCDIISIVAGASAPDWIIREVETQMSELENAQVVEEVATEEQQAVAENAVAEAVNQDKNDENTDFLAEMEKTFVKIKRGQFVKGVVVLVTEDEVCVNIGYKSDGIIRKDDLTIENDKPLAELFKVGDEIEAEVITLNDGEGNVRLSRKKIEKQIKWRELVENLDENAIYSCKVLKVTKGGVLSEMEGYEAFIPASQLSLKYIEDLNVFVGQNLDVKIIDIDKRQKRFVLSHKEVLLDKKKEEEKKLFESFEKGAVVKGVVKRLTDFGAFVDIGNVDGLLHITDISWVRIKHPKEVLTENQEIEVKILNVDADKKKISLGYKQIQPRPWDLVPQKYAEGDIVDGKVVRIAPFGAFVEIEPLVEGLVHISQVANKRIEKVEDVLAVGQEIKAKILEVNGEKRRISLSIKALIEPEKPVEEEKPEEDVKNEKDEDSYVIPPVEEVTTSLADFFKKDAE